MPTIRSVFQYWTQYGTKSLFGHSWELLKVNPHRFRMGYVRRVPEFSNVYVKKELPIKETEFNKPLKICYLIHYFYPAKRGGTERFVLNLAQQQKALGNEVVVVTLGNEFLNKYNQHIGDLYYRTYEYEDVPVVEVRHKKAPLGLYYKDFHTDDVAMEQFAKVFIAQEAIDVVHAAYPQPFYSFVAAAKSCGVPTVLTGTDFNMLCHYATMVDRNGDFCDGSDGGMKCQSRCKTYGCKALTKRHNIAEEYLATVQWITVPSSFVAKVFSKEFPSVAIQVVPHGIGAEFKPEEGRTSTKKFVYAGTLSELKGVHLLLDAFEKLEGDVTLDIYGPTNSSYAQQLMHTADKRIQFHGAVEATKMVQVYQNADCVIVPSIWYETYNFVVREALACGCLVIASDIGAMPEAIVQGKNGFLFEPGNEITLKQALQQAVEFDWAQYQQSEFQTIQEEGKLYNQIYHEIVS